MTFRSSSDRALNSFTHTSSETTDLSVLVYPNPFKESFELILSNHYDKIEFYLYDLHAKMLLSITEYNTSNISVSKLNIVPGIYFYKLESDNKTIYTGKIIAH